MAPRWLKRYSFDFTPNLLSHCIMLRVPLVFVLAIGSTCAFAQYKCQQGDGTITYQQTACATDEAQERVKLYVPGSDTDPSTSAPDFKTQIDELDRRRLVRDAIESGRPMVSMTRQELEQAMGYPDAVSAAQYGPNAQDRLVYYRDGHTIYVYIDNGVVSAIQNTVGVPSAQRKATCPTPAEIRDIEIEISKIENRNNARLQAALSRRLSKAKSCH